MSAWPGALHARRLQARLQPVLAQARSRWRGLSQRERKQILGMLAVVAVAFVWLVLVKPPLATLRHWNTELPRLRSQAAALADVLSDAGSPATAAASSSAGPAERVRASLDASGLAGAYQLREAGAAWEIEFGDAAAASRVMDWLLAAPASLGMVVQQATLQRSEDGASPGQKSHVRATATVALKRQPGNGS
ncbi:type II secretion system protein GspM [Polaromonas sp. YR568]|uniref:type II secretion system protein GspM n=1 Tax=Polaromonas sp. YR568 TaxID=1855301 RepID=UPI00398C22F9